MKKLLFLLLIVFILILSVFKVNANDLTFPLIGKMIVIDPGHGGIDQGASYNDIKEAELNLLISLQLKNELEKLGAVVIMTRDDNYDLSKPNALYRKKSDFDNRIKLINNSGADLYLSIHLDKYTNAAYYGPQVFYTTNFSDNEKLAFVLQKTLNAHLKTKRKTKINSSANYMYPKLNVKGVLIECGFLSNNNERNKLLTEEYQKELAGIIAAGINQYYS